MTHVHAVVPAGIDDPERPSGGNAYDRRVLDGLRAAGWTVHEHLVAGSWPRPDAAALAELATVVAAVPPRSVLLVDGLVGSCSGDVLVAACRRVRVVVLVHMALLTTDAAAGPLEGRVLRAASAVVTTSQWTRRLLLDAYGLAEETVHVAHPGVAEAPLAPGTPAGGSLLCVGAIAPHKGHADLADALGLVGDLPWRAVLAGSLDVDPGYVDEVRRRIAVAGMDARVALVGPLAAASLDRAYAAADLVVVPSRAETFGMVVTEALARGLPVLATRVGGVPEALGADGPDAPGILVPPDDPAAMAGALRAWLGDDDLRSRLRERAARRRATLSPWSRTVADVAHVLQGVSRD